MQVAVQVIKVEEDRGAAHLRIIRCILIKSIEFWALEILGGIFGYRTEEIGREVAKLHDLPRIFGETELLTHLLAAL